MADMTIEFEGTADLDPARGSAASVWRSWAEHAPPELLEYFNGICGDRVRAVRSQYPSQIDPRSGLYRNMRRDCVNSLNRLSEEVAALHDSGDLDHLFDQEQDEDA